MRTITRRLIPVALCVGLAGAAGVASAAQAGAVIKPHATTVCDNSAQECTNISSLLLNQGNGPIFIQNATTGQAQNAAGLNRRVNLRQASNTRSNEDFVIKFVGRIGQLCPNLIFPVPGSNSLDPTSYACLHYPFFYPVYQGEFAPNSNETGQCVGAVSATEHFRVRLERCGSPQTFWVADLAADIQVTNPGGGPLVYFPLEFAADRSASNPLVMTLFPDSTNPAHALRLQQENFSGGRVPDRQMFTLTEPVAP